ncbi:MAG: DUF5665 domain-containing protein [Patescibacteria group bacterium]
MGEKYDNVLKSKKQIFANNLIGGLAWGIGVTIGLTLLITLLGFIASRIDFVPIVGSFVANVINFAINNNPAP